MFLLNISSSISLNYLGCLDIFLIINFLYAVFKVHSFSSFELNGDNEIRTRDLLLARQSLSQLSYTPKWLVLFYKFGSHLLSHTVSSAVSSAAWVLTIVFGMGTGVTPKRIATERLSS